MKTIITVDYLQKELIEVRKLQDFASSAGDAEGYARLCGQFILLERLIEKSIHVEQHSNLNYEVLLSNCRTQIEFMYNLFLENGYFPSECSSALIAIEQIDKALKIKNHDKDDNFYCQIFNNDGMMTNDEKCVKQCEKCRWYQYTEVNQILQDIVNKQQPEIEDLKHENEVLHNEIEVRQAKLKGLAIEYEKLRTNFGYIESALLVSDAENDKLKQQSEYWEKEANYWRQCFDPIEPDVKPIRPKANHL